MQEGRKKKNRLRPDFRKSRAEQNLDAYWINSIMKCELNITLTASKELILHNRTNMHKKASHDKMWRIIQNLSGHAVEIYGASTSGRSQLSSSSSFLVAATSGLFCGWNFDWKRLKMMQERQILIIFLKGTIKPERTEPNYIFKKSK